MSGNALHPYFQPNPNPLRLAYKQGKILGLVPLTPNLLVQELRWVDAAKLVNSIDGFKVYNKL